MAPDTIEREVTIAAPIERVWTILTEAEHIGGWFADAGAEIDLRPGGALVMRWAEHGTTPARVEAVEPPHRFAYRWTAHHAEAGAEPVEGNSTLVEFTLTPEGTARACACWRAASRRSRPPTSRPAQLRGQRRRLEADAGQASEYAERVAA